MKIFSHYCCELVLTQKKVAKHFIGKNGSRDLYRSPNHQYGNHMSCPYGGPVVHRQKTPPNMGRLGCVCQVLSPKGHDCSFQYWWFWLPQSSLEPFLPLKCLATFIVSIQARNSSGQLIKIWRFFGGDLLEFFGFLPQKASKGDFWGKVVAD